MSVRRADEVEGQSRAVDVGGREHACLRCVFVGRQAAVARDRSIVYPVDGDRHGADVGNERTIAGREREAGRAIEVRIGRVDECSGRSVGDRDAAVSVRRAAEAEGQSRAVDVGRRERACRRCFFVGRQAAVIRGRSIVHRVDRDRHGADVGNQRTVAGREREAG